MRLAAAGRAPTAPPAHARSRTPSRHQAQYVILRRDDLLQRQAKAMSEVTSILGLNEDEAARVLRKFKW